MRRALGFAFVASGLVLTLLLTLVAFGLPVGESVGRIVEGAFGTQAGLSRTLVKATPLLLCGLGMVIAWRAGMYNIGGEGQFIVGALAGAWVARLFVGLPGPLLNPLILIATALGGAALAAFAGWLQVSRGVQVVISTILLNFVALRALDWAVQGPLQEAKRQLPLTDRLPRETMLLRYDPQFDLHAGVFVALAALAAVWVYLSLTKSGFRLKVVGENPGVARAQRIPAGRTQILAIALSGALCGLAGGIEYTGMTGQLGMGFPQDWGFMAIPVALLGGLHPAGVGVASLYFGALFAGSEQLQRFAGLGSTLVLTIQGVAVLAFVGFDAWRQRGLRAEDGA